MHGIKQKYSVLVIIDQATSKKVPVSTNIAQNFRGGRAVFFLQIFYMQGMTEANNDGGKQEDLVASTRATYPYH